MIPSRKNIIAIISICVLFLNSLVAQQVIDSLKLIDYHVHIFSKELMANLATQGFDLKKSGFQFVKKANEYAELSTVFEDNDARKMVLISTGYAYKKLGGGESESEFVKSENDLLAELVQQKPERLLGFYGINPLSNYASKEIIRCDEILKLDGIKLHLQASNLNLKDSIHLSKLKKVFSLASERNIPLLIHNNARDNSFGKAYFNLFEKEILEEFQELTIIFAHVGGEGGFFQFGYDILKAFNSYQRRTNDLGRHRIYFDLSGVVNKIKYPGEKNIEKLRFLMEELGFEKFLFGSDYPLKSSRSYVEELREILKLDALTLKEIVEKDIFSILRNKNR